MARWDDKLKNDKNQFINNINQEVSLVQKDHFKHLQKMNRFNLDKFNSLSDEMLQLKIDQKRNDLKITIMLVIIILLTLINLFR